MSPLDNASEAPNPFRIHEPTIGFSQSSTPGLTAGKYDIEIAQNIYGNQDDTDEIDSIKTNHQFVVTRERFSFQNDEIESIYPADLAKGNFSGTFASAVFKRPALPWERYLSKNSSATESPWLAILLVDINDDVQLPNVQTVEAKALVEEGVAIKKDGVSLKDANLLDIVGTCPKNILTYPGIDNFDYSENPNAACNIIDINKYLFKAIAPSKEDMKYIAHVREINYGNSSSYKETVENYFRGTSNPVDKKEDYSIIISNRFPKTDPNVEIFTHAFLVSLENMGELLKNNHSSPSPLDSDKYIGKDKIRLICYRSWRFVSTIEQDDLTSALKNLNSPSASNGRAITTLQFPTNASLPEKSEFDKAVNKQENDQPINRQDAELLVTNALMQGYVPLLHEMRHGNQNISWYRGPCSPQKLQYNPEQYKILGSADAANSYNPRTGFFDISYGAAWQLGQLLSLKNKTYVKALAKWKDEVRKNRRAGGDIRLQNLPEAPDTVINWFIQLFTLNGVPFNYIVPHEAMLPPESMRFFYLNRDWIDALLDGSFSLNRYHIEDLRSDSILIQNTKDYIDCLIDEFREKQPAGRFYDNGCEKISDVTLSKCGRNIITDKCNIFTGIIIRSQIVSSTPNLQITGYQSNAAGEKKTLQIFRLSKISQDCLICLFDGDVEEVWVHQPPEQIYCKAKVERREENNVANEIYTIHLRDVPAQQCSDKKSNTISFPPNSKIDISMGNVAKRIIDFENTAKAINRIIVKGTSTTTQITSADFAWQVLDNRIYVKFQVEK